MNSSVKKMSSDELKEKILIAKKAVENEPEPFKTEAFKIILNKLLNSSGKPSLGSSTTQFKENDSNGDSDDPLTVLANKAGLSKDDLMNVLDFKDNQFSLLRVKGKNKTEQCFYCALMILAFWKIGKGEEFISNVKLGSPISKYGIATSNLSTTLNKQEYSEFIVAKGKGKSKEYRITTKGIQKAFEIITELAQ